MKRIEFDELVQDSEARHYILERLKEQGQTLKGTTSEQAEKIYKEWRCKEYVDVKTVTARAINRIKKLKTDSFLKMIMLEVEAIRHNLPKDFSEVEAKVITAKAILYKFVFNEIQYIATYSTSESKEICEVFDIINNKIKETFKNEEIDEDKANYIFSIPNTVATTLVSTAMTKIKKTAGSNIYGYGIDGLNHYTNEMNMGKHKHTAGIEIKDGKKVAKLTQNRNQTNKTDFISLEVSFNDFDKAIKNCDKYTVMLFYYILSKGLQAYSQDDGTLSTSIVTFHLSELVNIGMFKTVDEARKRVEKALNVLVALRVGVKYGKTKRQQKKNFMDMPIFGRKGIKNSVVTILFYIDEKPIHWGFLFDNYTILPEYAFKLSENAFNLLRHIYSTARQGKNKASFLTIIRQLNLPYAEDTEHKSRDIIEQIGKAVAEIEQNQNNGIQLLFDCNVDEPTAQQINNGYLNFTLPLEERSKFEKITSNHAKKVNRNKNTKTQDKQ